MTHEAYIALGSNLGDRDTNIRGGMDAIALLKDTEVLARSSIIETDPVGPEGQGPYLNAAVHIRTDLAPRDLLEQLLRIEGEYGRDRSDAQRWGPRTLDLDILVYSDQIIDEPGLTVPHPRLAERTFVLVPLAEIAPEIQIPGHRETPRALLRALVNH